MLKQITTGVAALAALGALALGGSVIASAKQPATHYPASASLLSLPAQAPSSTADAPGGPNDQSESQTGPDTGSATEATSESDTTAEAPSSETDGPGGSNDQSGSQTGGPDTGSGTAAKTGADSPTEALSSEADGPGGPNIQSGSQTGPDTSSTTAG